MAVGIGFGIVIQGYDIPEIAFHNFHPKGQSVFPYLCISIACGAISDSMLLNHLWWLDVLEMKLKVEKYSMVQWYVKV